MKTVGACEGHRESKNNVETLLMESFLSVPPKPIIVLQQRRDERSLPLLVCNDIVNLISYTDLCNRTKIYQIIHSSGHMIPFSIDNFIMIAQQYLKYNNLVLTSPRDPVLMYVDSETQNQMYRKNSMQIFTD